MGAPYGTGGMLLIRCVFIWTFPPFAYYRRPSFCLVTLFFSVSLVAFVFFVFFISSRLPIRLCCSCWSGSVGRSHGWRTVSRSRPCVPCSRSWRTSEITAVCTSHHACRKNASWKSTSTPCRPNWGWATDPPSCPLKERWFRYVWKITHWKFPSRNKNIYHVNHVFLIPLLCTECSV